ncbi:hypothetical protein JZX87_13930 [Agrobacterium sp. Ap1]|uniref:spike base protein, RCAP_Rcc01079 family n=1 Tax=Agrobacterium sp. Ap1 TaxID=2815337 RepID=UPI001A8F83EE|nr:hypothetical protein [Agrobacterium sp. Ap1]MBO0142262.1 hypothetical protein [Agrobacterium sp. Ap1]
MANIPRSAGEPFRSAAAVTPSDSADLAIPSLLYVGTSGDIAVVTLDGSTVVLKNHPVGYMPGIVTRVRATGTTASNIVALS